MPSGEASEARPVIMKEKKKEIVKLKKMKMIVLFVIICHLFSSAVLNHLLLKSGFNFPHKPAFKS